MPHGSAIRAQNGDRARRTAGNDGPENYRKSGKLSELNAGGAARIEGKACAECKKKESRSKCVVEYRICRVFGLI